MKTDGVVSSRSGLPNGLALVDAIVSVDRKGERILESNFARCL
jgi:hypothetical protein